MTATPRNETEEPDVQHAPIGDTGRPAGIELVGLFVYTVSLAAYLAWLIVFGVNV